MAAEALESAGQRERLARPLFLATIVTGSFLLFLTQPMVARMALPRLGGAPAVWNSAMLVYQALLLGGYAYAHWLARLTPRKQAGLHLALFGLAALWLPIGLSSALPPADVPPSVWAPWFLLSSIGPLFFIISAQAPLMQRWYALESARGEPYALYAASNLGSFAGLLSYPLLVEPMLTLEQQSLLWTGGYALLVLLVAGCAFTIPARAVESRPMERTPPPERRRVAQWILLAAIPSGLMLSTTTHLTTDIVAMPLLWALPLGLYLLSFVVAFATRRGAANLFTRIAPLIILIAGGLAFSDGSRNPLFSATLGLLLLFTIAVALHSEMYRLRPPADHLTGFYLAMSVGGVLGGLFCAIVAPAIFDWAYEHPLLVLAAALLVPQNPLVPWPERYARHLALALPVIAFLISIAADKRLWTDVPDWAAIAGSIAIAVMALAAIGRRWVFTACLAALMLSYGGWATLKLSLTDARIRSYFGIYTIGDDQARQTRILTHGTTMHGLQNLAPGREREPTTYYAPKSAVGYVMANAPQLFGADASIGVVGLGTGTLACYARPGQDWRFFEIDPAIARIATSSGYFTFLSRCAAQAGIVIGDARLTIADQPPGRLDVLAVDAFSSDAVPMHLLTREAIGVYARALQPRGILLIHISNRFLDLEPVLASAAAKGKWTAMVLRYNPTAVEAAAGASVSVWVVMSRDMEAIGQLIELAGPEPVWEPLMPERGFPGWTDDYASILPLLRMEMPKLSAFAPGR